jgi:hypothetical protein
LNSFDCYVFNFTKYFLLRAHLIGH